MREADAIAPHLACPWEDWEKEERSGTGFANSGRPNTSPYPCSPKICGGRPHMLTRTKRTMARRGLTLMELVVVMTVLAALVAIVVPMFPNLLRRSHKIGDATNASEVAKQVQLHQAMYLSYPDEFDLMTTAGSTTAPDFL